MNLRSAAFVGSTFRSGSSIPAEFKAITRRGDLDRVLWGIGAAQRAGLSVKINVVALKGVNEDEFEPMVRWAHARGVGITFIEVMPLGEIETARIDQHLPLTKVREQLARHFTSRRPTIAPADRRGTCGWRRPAA